MNSKAFPGRVLFDHLPKTAGTAVTAWLTTQLGAGCVSPQINGSHRDLIRRYGGIYSVISAHVFFDVGEPLDPRYSYVTCLREPIDRAISWLYYAINSFEPTQNPKLHGWVSDFLESDGKTLADELVPSISNFYVRHFANIGELSPQSIDRFSVKHCLHNLAQYDVVGIQEDMSGFLNKFSQCFANLNVGQLERHRVNVAKPTADELSPGLRERLTALNQLDIELYRLIKEEKEREVNRQEAPPLFYANTKWKKYERKDSGRAFSGPEIIVAGARLQGSAVVVHGQVMTFDVDFFLAREIAELGTGIHIFDSERHWAFGTNNTLLQRPQRNIRAGSHRLSFHLVTYLPVGKYTAGFAFSERLPQGYGELAWYDALCEFEVKFQIDEEFAGYTYLPATILLTPTNLAEKGAVIEQPVGKITAHFEDASIVSGEAVVVEVEVLNSGNQSWQGDLFRPINLSYHWLDGKSGLVISEGIRSKLPAGGIPANATKRARAHIVAPNLAGEYILEITLVQETIGWFERLGNKFLPYRTRISIRHQI